MDLILTARKENGNVQRAIKFMTMIQITAINILNEGLTLI